MKTIIPGQIILSALLLVAALSVRADEEQAQFDILHSSASVSKKWQACQRLRVIGTAKAVAEVAALLTDPQLSQAARQTLDGLPYPEVDGALSDALGKTSGLLKAGIIDSMGWRGQGASVPLLIPLLADADTNIAAAAGTSLGRIGGKEAVAALLAARDQGAASVQFAIQASLLQCAERVAADHDLDSAAAIYRQLDNAGYAPGIRTAAWRGLVLTDKAHQAELMTKALAGGDHALELIAIKVLREANDPVLLQACAGQWASLPAVAQTALIDAEVKQGNEGLPLIRTASQSPDRALRAAAWRAMGDLNDLSSIPVLARAAAESKGAEAQAARESLARMRGAGASDALLGELKSAAAAEKVELLRALGARQDAKVANVLLENAAAGDEPVRLAALASLREIAPADALSPLLTIAAKADSDDIRDQSLETLTAVCQAGTDKDAAAKAVIGVEQSLPLAQQGSFLPLLAILATPDALATVQTASKSDNLDLAKDAVRALAQWPNSAPAAPLLDIARAASNPALKTLALRGAITVTALEPSVPRRLALLKDEMALATRPDEKKEALSPLAHIAEPDSLALALKAMEDPDVAGEASLAVMDIAEKLAGSHPDLASDAAAKVIRLHKDGELFRRAFVLRFKKGSDLPFISDWEVCGPYSRQGVVGALAIFKVPLGPEVRNQTVEWKAITSEHVNLAGMFPGAENCAAYLRTTILAPSDCRAMLLMGSDDGIKAWLNGKVVHSHNVDRGETIDEDMAPIHLKKGANELVLKISQGGGGWSVSARIVGADGAAVPGLRIQRPTGATSRLMGRD